MQVIIFGAQGYALSVYDAMNVLYPQQKISFFMVSDFRNNPSCLGGIPVREIADVSAEMTSEEKRNVEVVIGTPENVQAEIEEILDSYGFTCHSRMTSERFDDLMSAFHLKLDRFVPLQSLPVGNTKPIAQIFMAKSHKDRPLKQSIKLPEYVYPIQVGADNCDEKIADILDNEGENISQKNVNYCELTGLYWMWKHKLVAKDTSEHEDMEYYGLAQYRRMLMFHDDDMMRIIDNDVDVVLPYPLPYEPSIDVHHERYLKDVDWNALLSALKELQPEYADAFPAVLEQKYLYNYNVILAKKTVLREYCEWLFPILERTEELSEPKGCDRADRYIGYMGETLETLYFIKNADKLKVVHTGCKLYV